MQLVYYRLGWQVTSVIYWFFITVSMKRKLKKEGKVIRRSSLRTFLLSFLSFSWHVVSTFGETLIDCYEVKTRKEGRMKGKIIEQTMTNNLQVIRINFLSCRLFKDNVVGLSEAFINYLPSWENQNICTHALCSSTQDTREHNKAEISPAIPFSVVLFMI